MKVKFCVWCGEVWITDEGNRNYGVCELACKHCIGTMGRCAGTWSKLVSRRDEKFKESRLRI